VEDVSHRDYNSLCNICLVVAEENQSIGAKSPWRYLAPFRHKQYFARAMRRHLLPYKTDSALWLAGVSKAFREFRKQRLRLICQEFDKQAGMQLFRKERGSWRPDDVRGGAPSGREASGQGNIQPDTTKRQIDWSFRHN